MSFYIPYTRHVALQVILESGSLALKLVELERLWADMNLELVTTVYMNKLTNFLLRSLFSIFPMAICTNKVGSEACPIDPDEMFRLLLGILEA